MRKQISLIVLLCIFLLLSATSCLEQDQLVSSFDTDGDGWANAQEGIAGTDPNKVDTDGDGYWDPKDANPLDPNITGYEPMSEQPSEVNATKAPEEIPNTVPVTGVNPIPTLLFANGTEADELNGIQATVRVMMRNNNLNRLENPVRMPTDDMRQFPDAITKHGIAGVGFVLYLHDYDGDGKSDTNYIHFNITKAKYICDEYGNVTQINLENNQ
ncbi:hypothetical protein ACFLXC_01660 [Chloroflexota bacterium]